MAKIVTWVLANGATLLGCVQALIKAVKELLTGVVNLMSLFISQESAEDSVNSLRNFFNKLDGWIEIAKGYLLK